MSNLITTCESYIRKNKLLLSYIEKVLLIVILTRMSVLFFLSAEQMYQTIIDKYAWGGLVYLFGALLISSRINLKNRYIYISGTIYAVLFVLYTLKTGYIQYAHDLLRVLLRQGMVVGMLVLIVTDAICKKKFLKIKELDKFKLCLMLLTCIGFFAVYNEFFNKGIVVIFLIVALISFEYSEISNLIVCYSWAHILGATSVSVMSFITHPYTDQGRYYGAFTYLHGFGMYIGGGIICCLFLYMYGYTKQWYKNKLYLSVTPFFLFLIYTFILINSRGALLGIIAALFVIGSIIAKKTGKQKLIGLLEAIIAIILFSLAGLIAYLGVNSDRYRDFINKIPWLSYLVYTVKRTLKVESATGVFPDGSLLNMIDNFTNSRLSIWKVVVNQLKWFRGNPSWIVVNEEWTTGPHNTYLGFLNGFGIVVGSIFILLLFYVFSVAIKSAKSNVQSSIALFATIWYIYSLVIIFNEMVYLNGYYIIMCLLVMSILPKKKAEDCSNKE